MVLPDAEFSTKGQQKLIDVHTPAGEPVVRGQSANSLTNNFWDSSWNGTSGTCSFLPENSILPCADRTMNGINNFSPNPVTVVTERRPVEGQYGLERTGDHLVQHALVDSLRLDTIGTRILLTFNRFILRRQNTVSF